MKEMGKFTDSVLHLQHRITPVQHKAMNFIFNALKDQFEKDIDCDNLIFKVPVEYLTSAKVINSKAIRGLEKNLSDSMKVTYQRKVGNKTQFVNPLPFAEYEDGKRYFEIELFHRFRDICKEFFLSKENGKILAIPVDSLLKLKSSHSIRFFERFLLYTRVNRSKQAIELDDLKEWLGIEKTKYKDRFNNFNERILKSSRDEILKKTDLYYDYEKVTSGRTVTGVLFFNISIKGKKKAVKTPKEKKSTQSTSEEFRELIAYGVDSEHSEEYARKYPDIVFIKECIRKVNKRNSAEDKPSYLLGTLNKEWANHQKRVVETEKRNSTKPKSASEKIADNKKIEDAKKTEMEKCLKMFRELSKQEQQKRIKAYRKEKEAEGDTFFFESVIEQTLAREYCEEIGAIQSSVEQTVLDM